MMPGMDGIKTLGLLKEEELLPEETAVIALTANAFDSDRQSAFDSGCDEFLSKPISSDLCLKTIAKVLGE